jgi:hypothetical protein
LKMNNMTILREENIRRLSVSIFLDVARPQMSAHTFIHLKNARFSLSASMVRNVCTFIQRSTANLRLLARTQTVTTSILKKEQLVD